MTAISDEFDPDELDPDELNVNEPEIVPLDEDESATSDLGPDSAGQSGDTQGLLGGEESNSEGVKELLQEGQYYEASVVSGIEDVPPADEQEVITHQVPQNDVPPEYADEAEFRK